MNDSAFGELVSRRRARGQRTSAATAFPGTDGSFLAVVDVFVAATKAKNAKNALAFLSGISKPATQLAFSRQRGQSRSCATSTSRPCPHYQRASSKAFWTSPVLLSIAHGEGMSPDVPGGLLRRRRRPTSGHATRTRSQPICTNGSRRARSRNPDPRQIPQAATRK